MNNEIKVSLTIALRGSTMLSKEECLKTTQKVIERKTKTGKVYKKIIEVQVEDWDKMDKHTMQVRPNGSDPEIITFHTRKTKPTKQSINICKETYDYMIGKDSCPSWFKPVKWAVMSKKERLEAHLQRIAEHLGGTIISYKVFED